MGEDGGGVLDAGRLEDPRVGVVRAGHVVDAALPRVLEVVRSDRRAVGPVRIVSELEGIDGVVLVYSVARRDCGNRRAACIQRVQAFGGGADDVKALAGRGKADLQGFDFIEKVHVEDLLLALGHRDGAHREHQRDREHDAEEPLHNTISLPKFNCKSPPKRKNAGFRIL